MTSPINTQRQCYAAIIGGCRGSLSREHFISKSVLELGGSSINVTGHRWQTQNVQQVGPESLTCRVLCREHNTALGPVDKAGKGFFEKLVTASQNLTDPLERREEDTGTLSGILLERWFLKMVCGLWASKEFSAAAGWEHNHQPSRTMVELTFGLHALSHPQGLYFGGGVESKFVFNLPLTLEATYHVSRDKVLGVACTCNGINIVLNLSTEQENIEAIVPPGAAYRPPTLTLIGQTMPDIAQPETVQRGMQFIEFDWEGSAGGKHVWIHQKRTW